MKQINISHLRDFAKTHDMTEIVNEFPDFSRTSLYRLCKQFEIPVKIGKKGHSDKQLQTLKERNLKIITDYKSNKSIDMISKNFSLSVKQIKKILKNNNVYITQKEKHENQVLTYLTNHKPIVTKIVKKTGISETGVRLILKRLGIKPVIY